MTHDNPTEHNSGKQSPWRLRGVRLAAVILGLLLWHLTQSMIGQRAEVQGIAENTIVDQALWSHRDHCRDIPRDLRSGNRARAARTLHDGCDCRRCHCNSRRTRSLTPC